MLLSTVKSPNSFKVERNYFEKVHSNEFQFSYIKTLSKRDINTTTILCLSKTHQNKHGEVAPVFHRNDMKKNSKQPRFFCLPEIDPKK